jgi:hypothetical protein
LRRHLGDNPSPVQLAIIERVAMLQLRLVLLDKKAADGVVLTPSEEGSYASLNSALVRAMRALGLKAAAPRQPSLAEAIEAARTRRERDEAAAA